MNERAARRAGRESLNRRPSILPWQRALGREAATYCVLVLAYTAVVEEHLCVKVRRATRERTLNLGNGFLSHNATRTAGSQATRQTRIPATREQQVSRRLGRRESVYFSKNPAMRDPYIRVANRHWQLFFHIQHGIHTTYVRVIFPNSEGQKLTTPYLLV
jgi:hypothetical protein